MKYTLSCKNQTGTRWYYIKKEYYQGRSVTNYWSQYKYLKFSLPICRIIIKSIKKHEDWKNTSNNITFIITEIL